MGERGVVTVVWGEGDGMGWGWLWDRAESGEEDVLNGVEEGVFFCGVAGAAEREEGDMLVWDGGGGEGKGEGDGGKGCVGGVSVGVRYIDAAEGKTRGIWEWSR